MVQDLRAPWSKCAGSEAEAAPETPLKRLIALDGAVREQLALIGRPDAGLSELTAGQKGVNQILSSVDASCFARGVASQLALIEVLTGIISLQDRLLEGTYWNQRAAKKGKNTEQKNKGAEQVGDVEVAELIEHLRAEEAFLKQWQRLAGAIAAVESVEDGVKNLVSRGVDAKSRQVEISLHQGFAYPNKQTSNGMTLLLEVFKQNLFDCMRVTTLKLLHQHGPLVLQGMDIKYETRNFNGEIVPGFTATKTTAKKGVFTKLADLRAEILENLLASIAEKLVRVPAEKDCILKFTAVARRIQDNDVVKTATDFQEALKGYFELYPTKSEKIIAAREQMLQSLDPASLLAAPSQTSA